MTYVIFYDFLGLENGLTKLHDSAWMGYTLHFTHYDHYHQPALSSSSLSITIKRITTTRCHTQIIYTHTVQQPAPAASKHWHCSATSWLLAGAGTETGACVGGRSLAPHQRWTVATTARPSYLGPAEQPRQHGLVTWAPQSSHDSTA